MLHTLRVTCRFQDKSPRNPLGAEGTGKPLDFNFSHYPES